MAKILIVDDEKNLRLVVPNPAKLPEPDAPKPPEIPVIVSLLCLLRLRPAILEYIDALPPGTPWGQLSERWLRPLTRLPQTETVGGGECAVRPGRPEVRLTSRSQALETVAVSLKRPMRREPFPLWCH